MQISIRQKKKKITMQISFSSIGFQWHHINWLSSTIRFLRSNQCVANLDECKKRSNFLCLVYIFEVWILHSEYICQIIMFWVILDHIYSMFNMMHVCTKTSKMEVEAARYEDWSRRSRLGFQLETPDNEKENEECMHGWSPLLPNGAWGIPLAPLITLVAQFCYYK